MKKYLEATIDKGKDTYAFIASTKDKDRDGEIIMPSAFKNLDAYLSKNPVILFGHDSRRPPIGKAVAGRMTDSSLIVDMQFADTEFGREVRYLVDNGFLNAVSVGFIPKAWDFDQEGVRVYTDAELLEISVVPIPANAAAIAIREADKQGVSLKEFGDSYLAEDKPRGETSVKSLSDADRIKSFSKKVK